MEDKEKPSLSHTYSLPSTQRHGNSGGPHRSQSVRSKGNKVWSFGDMAKAVGTGMTAFGSNVVNSSMAVGSEVYHGSVVVGSNVVEGTKAAGRVTKDVTLAAGEMVGSAAEATVQAGKLVTSASVNAVQDQTLDVAKWVADQRAEILENNEKAHIVMPGEDLELIAQNLNVSIHSLIVINQLSTRQLYPGKKLLLSDSTVAHPMEHLDLNESISLDSQAIYDKGEKMDVTTIRIEKPNEVPDLVKIDSISNCGDNEDFMQFTLLSGTDDTLLGTCYPMSLHGDLVKHIRLWYPEKLDLRYDEEEEGDMESILENNLCPSHILRKETMQEIHSHFPQHTQSKKWNLIFSSIYDGYSLQNFYRKLSFFEPPMLIVVEDNEACKFGAYLTNRAMLTEEFIGTGESWLFAMVEEHIKSYKWSGQNEYFFQGKSNCFMIGASDGKFGIYVDGNMNHGRRDECLTFMGWPEEAKDFNVRCIECFNFK